MRLFPKKTVILLIAVVTVFLLAGSVAKGKYQFVFIDRMLMLVLSPFEYVVSSAGYHVRQLGSVSNQMLTAYDDNLRLKAENEELRRNSISVNEVQAENSRLRALLDYKKGTTQFDLMIATVIARDPGTWTNVLMINRGRADGIAKDMPVVTAQGLVGNVVTVYDHAAKVQLLLDPRSAVGGLVQRPESRVAAIVEGNGANPLVPRMINLSRDADIIVGDKIVTSGFGGIYPKGIALGEVVDVVNDDGGLLKYAVLKPGVDFDRLEEVMVLLHSREPAPAVPEPVTQSAPEQALPLKGVIGQ